MKNEPHVCDWCSRAFGSASDKRRHMELAHREERESMQEERFTCDVCGVGFDRAQGLGAHRWRAHGLRKGEASGGCRRGRDAA